MMWQRSQHGRALSPKSFARTLSSISNSFFNLPNLFLSVIRMDLTALPFFSPLVMSFYKCCGAGPFFFGSGSANPVFIIRIRIWVTQKKTGSGSYLNIFLMFSKINIFFYDNFLPNLNILWHLKSKMKKLFW